MACGRDALRLGAFGVQAILFGTLFGPALRLGPLGDFAFGLRGGFTLCRGVGGVLGGIALGLLFAPSLRRGSDAPRLSAAAMDLPADQQAQAEALRLAEMRADQERLAAERAAAELAAAAVPRRAIKAPAQTLVLVADDSKVVRIKTGRLLAQHQYQIAYANDGLDAVQQMQAQRPDVLITDVEMPGMDGFELTRHIRAHPQTAQLPVIMITAADDRHREEADAAGVSVLLGKPYPEDALIAHIRLAMGQDAAAPRSAASIAHGALDALA